MGPRAPWLLKAAVSTTREALRVKPYQQDVATQVTPGLNRARTLGLEGHVADRVSESMWHFRCLTDTRRSSSSWGYQ